MTPSDSAKDKDRYDHPYVKKLSLSPQAIPPFITHSASLPITTRPLRGTSLAERRLVPPGTPQDTAPPFSSPLPLPFPSSSSPRPLSLSLSRVDYNLSEHNSHNPSISYPIPIPTQKKYPSTPTPTTPFTARANKDRPGHKLPKGFPDYHSLKSESNPIIKHRQDQREIGHHTSDHSSDDQTTHHTTDIASTPHPREFPKPRLTEMHSDKSSSLRTPSSRQSPTLPSAAFPSMPYSTLGQEPGNTSPYPSLPRFHPANYQSSNSNSTSISRRSRPPALSQPLRPLQPHHRHLSDAQQKLQQYQRDLVENAARAANMAPPSPRICKPEKPVLLPCRSPGTGPATPLMLEDTGDYLTAGMDRSQLPLGEGASQEFVDKLIRGENERRNGSGFHSGGSSPAVSPAGGRG